MRNISQKITPEQVDRYSTDDEYVLKLLKPYSEDDDVLIEVNLLHFLLDKRNDLENQFFRIVLLEHLRNNKITIGYNQLSTKEIESLAKILLVNDTLRKCFYNLDKWCVEHRLNYVETVFLLTITSKSKHVIQLRCANI